MDVMPALKIAGEDIVGVARTIGGADAETSGLLHRPVEVTGDLVRGAGFEADGFSIVKPGGSTYEGFAITGKLPQALQDAFAAANVSRVPNVTLKGVLEIFEAGSRSASPGLHI
jgi:hypothetical protein